MNHHEERRGVIIHFDRHLLRRLLKLGLAALGLLALAWILSYSDMVLTPLLLSFILALLINPLVVAIERRGLDRTTAVVLVMAALGLALALLLSALAPIIARELGPLSEMAQRETPATLLEKFKVLLRENVPWLKNPGIVAQVVKLAENFINSLFQRSVTLLPGLIPVAIALVLIPFMTFFLLKDGRRIKKAFIALLPNRYFEMAVGLLHKIDRQVGNYIRGQLLVSLCVGALAATALAILRVPYFLFIGVLAGLANMIPYFGPIVGGIPAVILNVVAKGRLSAALPVIAAFLLIRLIDDTLLSPNILGHSLNIHPLLVILVIFIGGEMFGIMGLLLCIPVTGVVKVIIQELSWGCRRYRALRGDG